MLTTSLQYRLMTDDDNFEPLFHYESIELDQALARRECEFFVKEGITYKQTSSAIEDSLTVIYVKTYDTAEKEKIEFQLDGGLLLEIREWKANGEHPIIKKQTFHHHAEVLHHIGSVYLYINNEEWERDSAEIDEDRLVFVLYMKKTGYKLEGK